MSKIILLNGAGSSGKTSIVKALQYLSDDPWVTFGIDTFIEMTPYPVDGKKNIEYFSFTSSQNDRGPTTRVDMREGGGKLFSCMADFAKILADKGNNIIIDEVLFDDEHLKSYVSTLSNHIVYFIGVYCYLSVMQNREILRRNRTIGLSNDQFDRVHKGLREYDLKINTNKSDFFENAKEILQFVNNHEQPQGFEHIRNGT